MYSIKSKYNYRCKACNSFGRKGDLIRWSKDTGAICIPCFNSGKHKKALKDDDLTEGQLIADRIREECAARATVNRPIPGPMPVFVDYSWQSQAFGDLREFLEDAHQGLF